ncbi:MAG TPA: class I SAM-dependent methyltransferase [Acidimicrobiales bacterium]|nr:class I SAM-dependent methyltransferase [Acidimicrobiales bacterium]
MTDVRTLTVTDELQRYAVAHGSYPVDAVFRDLRKATDKLGPVAGMQVGPDEGQLLTFLVGLIGARNAVEVGTFTGYSSLCIARALPADGKLICCDISDEWTKIGRRAWERARVADRIDLRLGPGLDTLRELPKDEHLDFVFIDADKGGYVSYWEQLVPRVRPGGLLLADNTLWSGRIVDEASDDPNVQALQAFNDLVTHDERVDAVVLPAFDGLTLTRKR